MKLWMAATILFLACNAQAGRPNIEEKLKGTWILKTLTCKGQPQAIDKDYSLSFDGKEGTYISKTKGCTQTEPEVYEYLPHAKLSIKSGVRKCEPNPCAADLPATECGKETNTSTVQFDVEFKDRRKTLVLSTSDPKSVDCIGPGQSKPAVFTFAKKGK